MVRCEFAAGLACLRGVARTPDNDRWVSTGPAQRVAPARVRTLIVDDSEAVREGLTRLLGAKPFCEVLGAVSDPADALERTRAARPHVILQDFSMPGIDPLDLIRALTACRPQPAVLVLSAFVDAPAERQAALAGATGWVLKDAEPEQLYAALPGAAGVRDPGRPGGLDNGTPMAGVTPPPPPPAEPEPAASLDARPVWALLRALAGGPPGPPARGPPNRAGPPPPGPPRHADP